MKNLKRIKRYLPDCSHQLHMQVCVFYHLIGKKPSRGNVLITKAYIERQIPYEEVRKLLKLR